MSFFLGIVLWNGVSRFNGEGIVFQMGGFIFKWACAPCWGIGFDGGEEVSKKIVGLGGPPLMPPTTMGSPVYIYRCIDN